MNSHRPPTNNFDAIRFAAASAVIVSHHFALSGRPELHFFKFHSLGGLGVLIFFSISGFLIAQSWDHDPHLGRFAARRFLRIWPALFCTLLLSAFVLGPIVTTLPLRAYFGDSRIWSSFGILWLNVQPTLPGVYLESPLPEIPNGSLWTIPHEVKFYIYFALLGLAGVLKQKRLLALLVAVLIVYVYAIHDTERVLQEGGKRLYKWEFATFFFVGVLMHYFREAWEPRARRSLIAIGLIVAAAFSYWLGRPLVACWLLLPFFTIAAGLMSFPFVRRFGRFGDLSYGIYIYSFPVQQTVLWSLPKMPFAYSMALTIAVTFALAAASWHIVEKRALTFKPSSKRYTGAESDSILKTTPAPKAV
ncbi:MAG: acyltransferase [Variovorax sp.]|nr:acyltransferase [Variovorax sp.]